MAGEIVENITGNLSNVTDIVALQSTLGSLVTLFQILGGILGIYLIYWTIMIFINLRKYRNIGKILVELKEINKKLSKK